jgi:hypothetical protein
MHKAEVLVGGLADAAGYLNGHRAFAPCFGFPTVTDTFLTTHVIAPLTIANPVAGATAAASLAFYAVDVIWPRADQNLTRATATHEYGHFALCSLMFKNSVALFENGYLEATVGGLKETPSPSDPAPIVNEAFADYVAGQVAGAAGYYNPDNSTPHGVGVRFAYCDATSSSCVEENFAQPFPGGTFERAVGRVVTTLHDAFDGQPGGGNVPGNADYWITNTMPAGTVPFTLAPTCQRNGSAGDEHVAMRGRAFMDMFRSRLGGLSIDAFMSALAGTMRAENVDWCGACDVLAYHYDHTLLAMPPAEPMVTAASPPPTPRQRWNLCLDPAQDVRRWMGSFAPPDPHLNLDQFCNACPPQHISPDGTCVPCPAGQVAFENRCTACPADHIIVGNTCHFCELGLVPGTSACRCRTHQISLLDGRCQDCGPNEIATGNTCVACAIGRPNSTGQRCDCPARHFNGGDGQCYACPGDQVSLGDHCEPCGDGLHPLPDSDTCVGDPIETSNCLDGTYLAYLHASNECVRTQHDTCLCVSEAECNRYTQAELNPTARPPRCDITTP